MENLPARVESRRRRIGGTTAGPSSEWAASQYLWGPSFSTVTAPAAFFLTSKLDFTTEFLANYPGDLIKGQRKSFERSIE
jgi:hypothetical protein